MTFTLIRYLLGLEGGRQEEATESSYKRKASTYHGSEGRNGQQRDGKLRSRSGYDYDYDYVGSYRSGNFIKLDYGSISYISYYCA